MKINAGISFIISVILMISAYCLNFSNFLMGYKPEVVALVCTFLYIASLCFLSFIKKGKVKGKVLTVILTVYTALTAIVILAAAMDSLLFFAHGFILLFDIILLPPFYGLCLFCDNNILLILIFVLCALLAIVNVYTFKKRNKVNE